MGIGIGDWNLGIRKLESGIGIGNWDLDSGNGN